MGTQDTNTELAIPERETHTGPQSPYPPPFETDRTASPLDAIRHWLTSLNADEFPYGAVLEEFRRGGKHFVTTALLELLSRIRSLLPEVRGADPSVHLLDQFLDAALDKFDGRFSNPTYLALSLLPLSDVDDLTLNITEVERDYDRLFVQLVADAMRFEVATADGSSGLLPKLRPDPRTTAKRCRLGMQAIAPAARRLGLFRGEDAPGPIAAVRRLWDNLAQGLSPDERRTLQVTMMPVSLIHDEYQFIRILQSYEATFALVAVELREAVQALIRGSSDQAIQRIDAAESVLREAAPLFSLVATMQTEAFQTFRIYTEGASAIQSRNHKLIESLCRRPDPVRVDSIAYRSVPEVRERVLAGQVTLDDAFESARAAGRLGDRDAATLEQAMEQFATTLMRWRRTHYRLAARMLGERTGTGYTEGTPYLRTVQEIPVFTSLAQTDRADSRDPDEGHPHSRVATHIEVSGAAPAGGCPFSSMSWSDGHH